MTVVGGEVVDRAAQVEVADDGAGAQVKMRIDQAGDLGIGDVAGAEGLHVDGEGARHTDGVGDLDLDAAGEAGGDHVLGSPARGVSGGAVHLCGILAGEGAAAVTAHAAVGIDDDLAPGDAGISHGSADDEAAGGVDEEFGRAVEQLGGDDGVDDVLDDALGDIGVRDAVGVLGADEDGIDAHGLAEGVLHGDLGFAVRAQPGQDAGAAHFRQAVGELMGEVDGHGHERGGLVAGVAEHHPLVAGADAFELGFGDLAALGLERLVDAEGDIGRLGGDGGKHAAGGTVEALFGAVVADAGDDLAHELIEVDEGGGGDLAEDHDVAGLGGGLTCHAGAGVLLEAGIQNGVADEVTQFIGVAFGDRLGGKFEAGAVHERAG